MDLGGVLATLKDNQQSFIQYAATETSNHVP